MNTATQLMCDFETREKRVLIFGGLAALNVVGLWMIQHQPSCAGAMPCWLTVAKVQTDTRTLTALFGNIVLTTSVRDRPMLLTPCTEICLSLWNRYLCRPTLPYLFVTSHAGLTFDQCDSTITPTYVFPLVPFWFLRRSLREILVPSSVLLDSCAARSLVQMLCQRICSLPTARYEEIQTADYWIYFSVAWNMTVYSTSHAEQCHCSFRVPSISVSR